MSATPNFLDEIDHFVVLMLENRSFDHMLGFLYADENNVSPLGHPFEGLSGTESNPDENGEEVKVFKIPADKHPYFWPGTDPGEGYYNTNSQLYGNHTTPPKGAIPKNRGFITDFAYTLKQQRIDNESQSNHWQIVEGTKSSDIMGIYTPELLPVLSGLARGYAVCDHWFCSVPTETLPNRAFVQMATSQGRLNDADKVYSAKSIYNLLEQAKLSWSLYGYEDDPILTRQSLQALPPKPKYGSFGNFKDFSRTAKSGELSHYSFLAPEWGSSGNSQHPNFDVAKGEQYIYEVYQALKKSPQWSKTLFIVTYDEHGGLYDHVAPPQNAKQPKDCPDNDGFAFKRFGVRVPTVLVSPRIKAGTVFRVSDKNAVQGESANTATPFDHTSILATLEKRFDLPNLTDRDLAAPNIGDVLTLEDLREDDPMADIHPPKSDTVPTMESNGSFGAADHLQMAEAHLASRLPTKKDYRSNCDAAIDHIKTETEAKKYARKRYHQYYQSRNSQP